MLKSPLNDRVDFGLSFVPTSLNWRLPIALQVIFAIALLGGVYFLPDCAPRSIFFAFVGLIAHSRYLHSAPRWLLHQGHHAEAQRVVAALTDDTYDSEATLLQTRIIMQSIQMSHELGTVSKRNMFTNGPTQHFRRMAIGASSQIMQQIVRSASLSIGLDHNR